MPVVSIWILDKRSMAEGGASPAEIEAAAETARRDAGALARIKHPAVVKVCCARSLMSRKFCTASIVAAGTCFAPCCREVNCATSLRLIGSTISVMLPLCTCPTL